MTVRWGVLLLAAGAGTRMGGVAKCLIEHDGVSLLAGLLQSVAALHASRTVLVLGHHAHHIERALHAWPLAGLPVVVRNAHPGESPASSLRLGLRTLLDHPQPEDAVMVLLADMPLLRAQDLQDAQRAFAARTARQRIVWPVHGDMVGHPVLLEMGLAREWLLQSSLGLRVWAQQHPAQVAHWHPGHARCTTDLDTPQDLARLAHDTGHRWTLPPQQPPLA